MSSTTPYPNGQSSAGPSSSLNQSNQLGPSIQPNGTQSSQNGDLPQQQDLNQLYQARREEEAARKDRSLAEFLVMLDGYKPLVSSRSLRPRISYTRVSTKADQQRYPKRSRSITFNERGSTVLIQDCRSNSSISKCEHRVLKEIGNASYPSPRRNSSLTSHGTHSISPNYESMAEAQVEEDQLLL